MTIKLPLLPNCREWPYSHQELRARDIQVARAALEAAAHELDRRAPAHAEMIRALRIEGETP
jgi:hypothetical protein